MPRSIVPPIGVALVLSFAGCGGEVQLETKETIEDDCKKCQDALLDGVGQGLCEEAAIRWATLTQCIEERCSGECPNGLDPDLAACPLCYEVRCDISVRNCEVS